MALSLSDRLVRYLKNQGRPVAKGDLEDIVVQNTKYTADNAGRRLRELAREGVLSVEIRKGHAWYSVPKKTLQELQEEYWNSI